MPNPNKQQAFIYITLKNVPYTDEEWALYRPDLPTRPMHSHRCDSGVRTQEEARKICEEALRKGAQMAMYVVAVKFKLVEKWAIRRGGEWYQIK